MKRFLIPAASAAIALGLSLTPAIAQQPGGRPGRPNVPPPIQPKPEELAKVKEKTEQIEALVKDLKAKHADAGPGGRRGGVRQGRPDAAGISRAVRHPERDRSLLRGARPGHRAGQAASERTSSPWNQGKKQIHAYYSEIDGSVQPYAITLPESYDPAKPARLYVWLHGRQNNTTEAEFIFSPADLPAAGNVPVADQGQIQLDCFGRINSAGWHWAGEADVFEGIAAVKKRFKIDDQRVHAARLLAWAAKARGTSRCTIRTASRRPKSAPGPGRAARRRRASTPYQYAALKIWENMEEWALNVFNLPLAGHDGDTERRSRRCPDRRPARHRGQLDLPCAPAPSWSGRAFRPKASRTSCA